MPQSVPQREPWLLGVLNAQHMIRNHGCGCLSLLSTLPQMLDLDWPREVLRLAPCKEVKAPDGSLVYRWAVHLQYGTVRLYTRSMHWYFCLRRGMARPPKHCAGTRFH